jgi:hypothetical protein
VFHLGKPLGGKEARDYENAHYIGHFIWSGELAPSVQIFAQILNFPLEEKK